MTIKLNLIEYYIKLYRKNYNKSKNDNKQYLYDVQDRWQILTFQWQLEAGVESFCLQAILTRYK